MIGKKRKKPNAEELSEHFILGRLIKKDDWVTEKNYSWEMFGNKYDVFIYVSCNDDGRISSQQNVAISFLINNFIQLQSQSEQLLLNFFSCKNTIEMSDSISVENISITKGGKIVLSINSSFSDEFINNNLPSSIIFDDCFGISIYPEQIILTNEKEFNLFITK